MRWLALILLIANVGFFAWTYHLRLERTGATRPMPPLPADVPSLALLGELEQMPPKRAAAVGEAPVAEGRTGGAAEGIAPAAGDPRTANDARVATTAGPVLPAPYTLPPEGPPPPPLPAPLDFTPPRAPSDVCLTIGPFAAPAEYAALEAWLAPRSTTLVPLVRPAGERRLFWVYLAPQSAEQAQADLAELERRGVQDFQLVRRAGLENAISLGVFSSQDAVNRRLAEITEQGYQPVVVPRIESTPLHFLGVRLAETGDAPLTLPGDLLGAASAAEVDCGELAAVLGGAAAGAP